MKLRSLPTLELKGKGSKNPFRAIFKLRTIKNGFYVCKWEVDICMRCVR